MCSGNVVQASEMCGYGRKSTPKWVQIIDAIAHAGKTPTQLDDANISYSKQIDRILEKLN
jgi:hypothetical protein